MTNKEKTGLKIKTARMSRGISQQRLAELVGCSQSAIGMYESGAREPSRDTLEALADVFNVPLYTFFMDEDEMMRYYSQSNTQHMPNNLTPANKATLHSIPRIGKVAAGEPILADEEYETWVDGPLKADYALTVVGRSMEPVYLDGDTIYIRQQPDVNDGEIGVVLIDDEATLKRVYHTPHGLTLLPENPKFKPIYVNKENSDAVRILGIVVGFTRMYTQEDKLRGVTKGFPKQIAH